jgi:acyl-homoserine-lactone acylase
MNKRLVLLISLIICFFSCQDQRDLIPYEDITIYRDSWGVPHIHAPTDEQVAYGLAWATAEDDFNTIQEQMLALNGKYGEHIGKDGLIADFGIHFMDIMRVAEQRYQSELSPKMIKVIAAYADGINAFADAYPEEVYNDDLFPVGPADVVAGYMLGLVEISGAGKDLQSILSGDIVKDLKSDLPTGSNAIAISNSKTVGEETFLAINSHQPLEGWYSWYEAHLISDEGQNILGGTFPGGATIFHGTNEHLGWAHTVNHADFSDVYQLDIDPEDKMRYRVDGQWYTLEKESVWAWMKLAGPLKVPIKRTKYSSIYGPTFITDQGTFAWSFAAHESVAAVEQWYDMGRATNLEEFQAALARQDIPCTNIVYADQDHNIMYISNGAFPIRDDQYDWRGVLSGDTKSTLWSNDLHPIEENPQVLNPVSGYVFNTNNTPYSSTGEADNPIYDKDDRVNGYQAPDLENNRSKRFMELIDNYDSLSYDDFKTLKYDVQYPEELQSTQISNLELILSLSPDDYPQHVDAIQLLNKWNRRCDSDNTTAPLFLLTQYQINEKLKAEDRYIPGGTITESDVIAGLSLAKEELIGKFGKLTIELSQLMRHTRGDVSLPVQGGTDVLAAMYGKKQEDGTYRVVAGESYIQMVRFQSDTLPIIETINAYGSSAEPDSPHYTDQMQLFTQQKLKSMTLSLEEVKATSMNSYHPMRVE